MDSEQKYFYQKFELNDETLATLKAIKAVINLDWIEKRSYFNQTLEKVKRHQTYVC